MTRHHWDSVLRYVNIQGCLDFYHCSFAVIVVVVVAIIVIVSIDAVHICDQMSKIMKRHLTLLTHLFELPE